MKQLFNCPFFSFCFPGCPKKCEESRKFWATNRPENWQWSCLIKRSKCNSETGLLSDFVQQCYHQHQCDQCLFGLKITAVTKVREPSQPPPIDSTTTMELKVWVEGIQRIVCGVTDKTTCQVRNILLFDLSPLAPVRPYKSACNKPRSLGRRLKFDFNFFFWTCLNWIQFWMSIVGETPISFEWLKRFAIACDPSLKKVD